MNAADPRSSIVALLGSSARGEHRFLELGDGKLPIRLTKRDQPNSGRHQIALRNFAGRRASANSAGIPCLAERAPRTTARAGGTWRSQSVSESQSRSAIRPDLAERCEAGRRLLGRFERKFRCPAKGGGQFRNFQQLLAIIVLSRSATPR